MLALAAVAAVLLLARDGDDDEIEQRRAAVSAYIVQVNTTQQALIVQLEQVSRAYRELRLRERPVPGQLERVEAAEETLRGLRTRLAALDAPPEARTLRAGLLELIDLQAGLAAEVAGMVRYLPVQAAENRRLAAATETLRDALTEAETGAAQREAFDVFRAALQRSARTLDEASAPDVLEPSRTGEVARLERLATLARQIGQALEDAEAEDVDRLFPQFVQTSASTGTTKAERDAVIAFNKKLAAVADQRAEVVRERARVDLNLR
ncbi:MAG TPA: hypothetical protein VF044_08120 [Actinomycetota bacterium]